MTEQGNGRALRLLTWRNWSICTEQLGCQSSLSAPLGASSINAFANWTCCHGFSLFFFFFLLCFASRLR